MVSEKVFLCFSHYKSMGVLDPQGVASLDSRPLDWQDLCYGALDVATY